MSEISTHLLLKCLFRIRERSSKKLGGKNGETCQSHVPHQREQWDELISNKNVSSPWQSSLLRETGVVDLCWRGLAVPPSG